MLTKREHLEKKYLFVILIIYLFWHICARIGLSIDLQWHIDVGRDQMFTPPHIMILAGLFPAHIEVENLQRTQNRYLTAKRKYL